MVFRSHRIVSPRALRPMTKTIPLVALWLAACAGLFAADAPVRRYTPKEIEAAIRAGKAGAEFAERAKKMENLHLAELRGQAIPYQVFYFSDFAGGYSLLVEGGERFTILCRAIGGGFAQDFTMTEAAGQVTLHYRYTSGSGRMFEHRMKYVLGSGQPETVGDVRDITPRTVRRRARVELQASPRRPLDMRYTVRDAPGCSTRTSWPERTAVLAKAPASCRMLGQVS